MQVHEDMTMLTVMHFFYELFAKNAQRN